MLVMKLLSVTAVLLYTSPRGAVSQFVDPDQGQVPGSCAPNPCLNGGICSISPFDPLSILCTCSGGLSGSRCEIFPVECRLTTCMNGGTCGFSNIEQPVQCQCPLGFSGDRCEIAPDLCESNPCLNGGTCEIRRTNPQSIRCTCPEEFSGFRCELITPEQCGPTICQNGGTCGYSNFDQSLQCQCLLGFSGDRCEMAPDLCESNPCLNGGTCGIIRTNPQSKGCTCPEGFSGSRCERTEQCPENICVVTRSRSSLVTFSEPAIPEDHVLLIRSHEPNTRFPRGVTMVSYHFAECQGTVTSCSFFVSVGDDRPPIINGVPNVTRPSTSLFSGEEVIRFEEPTTQEPSDILLFASHRSGDPFQLGSTSVNYTFSDVCGRTSDYIVYVTVTSKELDAFDALFFVAWALTVGLFFVWLCTCFCCQRRIRSMGDGMATGHVNRSFEGGAP